MATLGAGYNFGATETVSNSKLATLVNSGTCTNIAQADIASSNGLVFVGTSAPSDTDQVWVDTSSTPVVLRFYNSNLSAWVTPSSLALYTNKSGQTGSAGRVLILDTSNSNSYTYTSTEGDTKFLGIETASVSNNSAAPVIGHGSTIVNLEISASAGCYIRTSTATGKAVPVVNTAAGVFGFLTEAGTASARANIFGIDPNGTLDQTANYTWTGTHTFNGTVAITTASATTTNWSPIVQIVNAAVATSATGTTTIPFDNTIPQNTEGTQFMSAAITPKNSNNKLLIQVVAMLANSGAGRGNVGALFQDSNANALAASVVTQGQSGGAGGFGQTLMLNYYMTAGTTAATTFKFRAGPDSASTITFNGEAGVSIFGGVATSSINIIEIKV